METTGGSQRKEGGGRGGEERGRERKEKERGEGREREGRKEGVREGKEGVGAIMSVSLVKF